MAIHTEAFFHYCLLTDKVAYGIHELSWAKRTNHTFICLKNGKAERKQSCFDPPMEEFTAANVLTNKINTKHFFGERERERSVGGFWSIF